MFIPTVLALSKFFASDFPNFSWYPNWYLGNPYQYLIGPVVPAFLAIFNSQFSIFNSYLALIFLSFIVGSSGIYFLLLDWGAGKRQALVSSLLYLLMPFGIFLLNYQNGLSHIAFSILPFILLFYHRFLALHLEGVRVKMLVVLITFALLIDISILLPIIIGFISMTVAFKNREDWGYLGAKSALILLLGISLASIWYTPKFWWILLSNPSIGGVGLFNLIINLFKLLLNLLPIALAVLVARWRGFKPQGYLLFAVLFFSSFLFLSLVRFLFDPDFVMDWTGFLLELQFGGAILLGRITEFKIFRGAESRFARQNSKVFYAILFGMAILLNGYIVSHSAIQQPARNASPARQSPDGSSRMADGQSDAGGFSHEPSGYQSRIISMVKDNVKSDERIFLSGSEVFFINQYSQDVQQVRGGVDQGSSHPFWAHGAYQIREGSDSELAYNWLKILGASYILVHQTSSKDIFHDFKNTQKYIDSPEYFKQIKAYEGDVLYKVDDVSIARLADKKILSAKSPLNGADSNALSFYAQALKAPLEYSFKNGKIWTSGNIGRDEVISLAITYDPHFKIREGQGRLVKDSIGNMVIVPKKESQQSFVLVYQNNRLENIIPLIFGLSAIILLLNYHKVHSRLVKRFPGLHFGGEDDY